MDNECKNNNIKTYKANDSYINELDEEKKIIMQKICEKLIRITYTVELADKNCQKIFV